MKGTIQIGTTKLILGRPKGYWDSPLGHDPRAKPGSLAGTRFVDTFMVLGHNFGTRPIALALALALGLRTDHQRLRNRLAPV